MESQVPLMSTSPNMEGKVPVVEPQEPIKMWVGFVVMGS